MKTNDTTRAINKKGAMSGIRVLDWTSYQFGPVASSMMGDMGADVVKIESLDGDIGRAVARMSSRPIGLEGGRNAYFETCNRNKRGIALDLKTEQGIRIVHELVKSADVFVENFRPGTASRLGLSYENIKQVKPNIIYCSISGFGQDGPISNRPAYDHIVQGMCGIMRLTGTTATEPNKVGAPYVDYATGLNGAFAPCLVPRCYGSPPSIKVICYKGGHQ